jgi:hypothetical protein
MIHHWGTLSDLVAPPLSTAWMPRPADVNIELLQRVIAGLERLSASR